MADIFKQQFDKAREAYFKVDQVKSIRLTKGEGNEFRFAQHFQGNSGKMYWMSLDE